MKCRHSSAVIFFRLRFGCTSSRSKRSRAASRERRRAGLSQDELARRADLHRTAVGLLEGGKRIARADTLIQLAGALDVSPAAFFDGVYWTPDERTGGAFGVGPDSSSS